VPGHVWAIAARLRAPVLPPIETGVTNVATCAKRSPTQWQVYAKFTRNDKTVVWKCPTKVARNSNNAYSASIGANGVDKITLPGRPPIILDQTQFRVPRNGVLVDAMGRTDQYQRDIGGVWSQINYLEVDAQGNRVWRVPTALNAINLSSLTRGYGYQKITGASTPYTGFCAYGPARQQLSSCTP
jgi:hypothetical protein